MGSNPVCLVRDVVGSNPVCLVRDVVGQEQKVKCLNVSLNSYCRSIQGLGRVKTESDYSHSYSQLSTQTERGRDS